MKTAPLLGSLMSPTTDQSIHADCCNDETLKIATEVEMLDDFVH